MLTSKYFCTIRGLFLGLLGGLILAISMKSCSISSFERGTENLILSFWGSILCLLTSESISKAFLGGSIFNLSSIRSGALHAALLVLKFQGLVESSLPLSSSIRGETFNLLAPPLNLRSGEMGFSWIMIGLWLLGVSRLVGWDWNPLGIEEEDRWWGSSVSLTHLRTLWWPHFKQGNEKLCSGFDRSCGGIAISCVVFLCKESLCFGYLWIICSSVQLFIFPGFVCLMGLKG